MDPSPCSAFPEAAHAPCAPDLSPDSSYPQDTAALLYHVPPALSLYDAPETVYLRMELAHLQHALLQRDAETGALRQRLCEETEQLLTAQYRSASVETESRNLRRENERLAAEVARLQGALQESERSAGASRSQLRQEVERLQLSAAARNAQLKSQRDEQQQVVEKLRAKHVKELDNLRRDLEVFKQVHVAEREAAERAAAAKIRELEQSLEEMAQVMQNKTRAEMRNEQQQELKERVGKGLLLACGIQDENVPRAFSRLLQEHFAFTEHMHKVLTGDRQKSVLVLQLRKLLAGVCTRCRAKASETPLQLPVHALPALPDTSDWSVERMRAELGFLTTHLAHFRILYEKQHKMLQFVNRFSRPCLREDVTAQTHDMIEKLYANMQECRRKFERGEHLVAARDDMNRRRPSRDEHKEQPPAAASGSA